RRRSDRRPRTRRRPPAESGANRRAAAPLRGRRVGARRVRDRPRGARARRARAPYGRCRPTRCGSRNPRGRRSDASPGPSFPRRAAQCKRCRTAPFMQQCRCMNGAQSVQVDPELRRATIEVLRERGWGGLTLERVAEVAGRSRSTLWRQGLSREVLVGALTGELAEDFRAAMYPILTSPGTGRERLTRGLEALCDLLDSHLPLMLANDEAFHQQTAPGT